MEKLMNLKRFNDPLQSVIMIVHEDAFKGNIFCHSFLCLCDYDRFHSPIEGIAAESGVIRGQTWREVDAVEKTEGESKVRALANVDGTGFQFVQMRGHVVIESPIGLVACLPTGMGIVSSIVLTAEAGLSLRMGEELGCFQANGSDFVMVFRKKSNVALSWKEGVEHKHGEAIGVSHANFLY